LPAVRRLCDNPNWHALLLIEPPNIPVGAVSFNWMDWKNTRHGWHLAFVWIAPWYQGKTEVRRVLAELRRQTELHRLLKAAQPNN
jgi:hypothetical protein